MKNNTKYSTNNRKYSEIMKNNESLQMQKWDGAESSEFEIFWITVGINTTQILGRILCNFQIEI